MRLHPCGDIVDVIEGSINEWLRSFADKFAIAWWNVIARANKYRIVIPASIAGVQRIDD